MSDSMRLDTLHPIVGDHHILEELLEEPGESPDLVRFDGLADEFEAEYIRDALSKEGIRCVVQSNRETAFDGLFIPQKSWGSLIFRADQAEVALGVITAVRSSYASSGSGDLPEELQDAAEEE
jgi:hypothetical protein